MFLVASPLPAALSPWRGQNKNWRVLAGAQGPPEGQRGGQEPRASQLKQDTGCGQRLEPACRRRRSPRDPPAGQGGSQAWPGCPQAPAEDHTMYCQGIPDGEWSHDVGSRACRGRGSVPGSWGAVLELGGCSTPGLKWFPLQRGATVWFSGSQQPPYAKCSHPPGAGGSLLVAGGRVEPWLWGIRGGRGERSCERGGAGGAGRAVIWEVLGETCSWGRVRGSCVYGGVSGEL